MAFQEQLKKLMIQNHMKAVDLARATGLSEAAVSDYLKGKKEPRGRQSISIANALNVSLDTLWETGFQQQLNTGLTESEETLLSNYRSLNAEGREKILTYAVDIVDSGKYQLPKQMNDIDKKCRYKLKIAARDKGL